MTIDEKALEKAFQVAWVAWTDSAHTKHYAKLQDAITAYEQARERVAVPSREEIAAGLSTAYQASELNADEALEFDDIPEDERQRHLWMADYVLTLLRQAPSAQPWTRELASLIRKWRNRGDAYRSTTANGAVFDECADELAAVLAADPAPVASAQGAGLATLEDIARDLENLHGIRDRAQAMNVAAYLRERMAGRAGNKPTTPAGVALQGRTHQLEEQREALETAMTQLERDLAAERAAHQATKADCERRMNDWQDTHEQEVEQLKDDLATERAAHEATRARLKQRSADLEAATVRKATAEQAAADWKARAEAAEKRIAELERERDEAYERGQKDLAAKVDAALDALWSRRNGLTADECMRSVMAAIAQESAKPAEPKPGDVLSGETAAVYPDGARWRRKRRTPEPAKPATPDLDLAAVTVRVDELELTALQLLERVAKLEGK